MATPRERTILIIDDDPEIADLMRLFLAWVVEHVVVSNDPMEGIELARTLRPDLILCDISMPGLSGFDVRRRLAEDPDVARIPFVFVSSNSRVDSQLTGLRLGATAYLTKPVHRDTLVATILHLLDRKPTLTAVPAVPVAARSQPSGQLNGVIEVVSMPDLLQLLEASQRSGVLEVRDDAVVGQMTFATGRVVDARIGDWTGEDAALRMVWMTAGGFAFVQHARRAEDELLPGWPVTRLLIDAAWLQDELGRLGSNAPRPNDTIIVEDAAGLVELFPGHELLLELGRSREGVSVVTLAKRLELSILRCRALLGAAVEKRAVRIVPVGGRDGAV